MFKTNLTVIDNSNDTSNGLQFEDNLGDVPEDARKGDLILSLAKDDDKGTDNLNTQENKRNTEESKLYESENDKKQLDSEVGRTNNNSGENLPKDASGAKDGGTGNLNTPETEDSKLDESKKDKKQLDSEGGQTINNNKSGENFPNDASEAKDGGTSNLNTPETEESKSNESKKDKKQLDSEGGQTNNNKSGENFPKDASGAKDGGTGNLNTPETGESESDESKKDKKQLNSEGGQTNVSGDNLFKETRKGDLNESLDKGDGTENLNTKEKNTSEESNLDESKKDKKQLDTEAVSNENDKKSDSGSGEKKPDKKSSETNVDQNDKNESNKKDSEGGLSNNNSEEGNNEKNADKSDSGGGEKKPDENYSGMNGTKVVGQIEGKVDQNYKKELDKSSDEAKNDHVVENQSLNKVSSSGAQSILLSETSTRNGSFSTQAAVSKNEKKTQLASKEYIWKLCNSTAGPDYIPCLDNWEAIKHLRTNKHYEHRERHCPEEPPTCLGPLSEGYRCPIGWPKSRENGHQNWVKVTREYLTFLGGGTQFKHGALLYIDFIEEVLLIYSSSRFIAQIYLQIFDMIYKEPWHSMLHLKNDGSKQYEFNAGSAPDIAWRKRSRVVLDVGCGVASFGGFLFDRNVLVMSFAPKDEHEAQVQFALERGIPDVSSVMGTKKLPYHCRVFDIVHCARCRVPWHIEGGKLLLELNRLLRPGGFFVWSATPVYQKGHEDDEIWKGT
ncbi:putative methyltransferase PMT26 [Hibiscus syriacus]|uniref:Methyltransferase n=1 Tax=Hibiscus syriacus TaxID=106335 RepID=A0A6A2WPT6_HIBSY|nr:putative methyltransferase PMT26 [Hibiscus syriacus]